MILFFKISFGQSIRKNHLEMTQSEKDAFISAFKTLHADSSGLLQDLTTCYIESSQVAADIYTSFNYSKNNDVFFAWHRKAMLEVEQSLQSINPSVSMPYWDWITDDTGTTDLWGSSFMGSTNFNWTILRDSWESTINSNLLNSIDISSLQSSISWDNYTRDFQVVDLTLSFPRGIMRPEITENNNWGILSRASPNDPAFYAYFGNLDRLWADWVIANGKTNNSDLYTKTDMPRYDGTYSFNGQTISAVDPDDLIESNKLGVFYANGGIAELENYTVSNSVLAEEIFYYQYTIEAKNSFTVPTGKSAKFESVNEIILKPGFHAEEGSVFTAKIDTDNNINTSAKNIAKKNNSDTEEVDSEDWFIKLSPNPASNYIVIEFDKTVEVCNIQVYNTNGSIVLVKEFKNQNSFTINIDNLSTGMYYIKIIRSDAVSEVKKFLKK